MSARRLLIALLLLLTLSACTPSTGSEAGDTAGGMGMGTGGGPATDEAIMMGGLVASAECTVTAASATVKDGAVVVPFVHAPTPGWLVVRDVAAPGTVLGYASVPTGESRDVPVRLTALGDAEVRVSLHADRGDTGVFEFDPTRPERSLDGPYYVDSYAVEQRARLEGYGETISPNSALIMVESQKVTDSVTVKYVLTPGPAWISVCAIEAGKPTRVVGTLARGAGETFGVVVPVKGVEDAEELAVLLHADLGAADTFEYDPLDPLASADQPYVSAGVFVGQRIEVR